MTITKYHPHSERSIIEWLQAKGKHYTETPISTYPEAQFLTQIETTTDDGDRRYIYMRSMMADVDCEVHDWIISTEQLTREQALAELDARYERMKSGEEG